MHPEAARRGHPRPILRAALRSVGALMLREMSTRYGRTPGGYLWAILEPLGMIIILGYAWSLLARAPALGTSFFLFKGTGFMVLQTFVVLGGTVGHALTFSRRLLWYPRVSWIDAVIARFALNMTVVFAVTVLILGGNIIIEDIRTAMNWRYVFLAMGLSAAMGLGLGCLNCYLFLRVPVWQQIWAIITRPLFIISGVILLFEDMPQQAQDALWYNPLLHLTGLMRAGFYPMYRPDYISLGYVGLWIAVPLALGLVLLRRYNRELLTR